MRLIAIMVCLAVIASCNRQAQQTQSQNMEDTKAALTGKVTYPDPWMKTYSENKVLSSMSVQYNVFPGKKDSAVIRDSIVYNNLGKPVFQTNQFFTRRSIYNDSGFLHVLQVVNQGGTFRYLFDLKDDPQHSVIMQRSIEMKDTSWGAPARLADSTRGYAPTFLTYDSKGHITKEISVDVNNTYVYDDKGNIVTVVDSSARTIHARKGPLVMKMTYDNRGVLTSYTDMIGNTPSEKAVLNDKGLIDTMKMYKPDGTLYIYRVFKYYYR